MSMISNCKQVISAGNILNVNRHCVRLIFKRLKHKRKPDTKFAAQTSTERALQYFDTYYRPVYGQLWPSIRVALLSEQKYGALVNNYCNLETCAKLTNLGANDMIESARSPPEKFEIKETRETNPAPEVDGKPQEPVAEMKLSDSDTPDVDKLLARDSDLYDFMPVEKVYSEKELYLQEESEKGVFKDNLIDVDIIKGKPIRIPEQLKVFTYKPGDVSDFPQPKPDVAKMLEYYLLDASSILPVLALDLRPFDTVLDLCAAPGGKSLSILQTLLPKHVSCNDASASRLKRLKSVLRSYIPNSEQLVTITPFNASQFTSPAYKKVLVDVPCSLDRYMAIQDDNNLFSPARTKERLQMAEKQRDILVAGIMSCRPGGSIVYSTCTLAPPQNDGVIQSTLEFIWQNTRIEVAIQDISPLVHSFKNTFTFFNDCRFGQLVIPSLSKNFGPMYICKIKRLK